MRYYITRTSYAKRVLHYAEINVLRYAKVITLCEQSISLCRKCYIKVGLLFQRH